MHKYCYLIVTLLAVSLAEPLAAQDEDVPSPADRTEPEGDAGQAGESAEADVPADFDEFDEFDEFDDADLDEQTYEDDDDDFVPTEEIPIDVPIPFPTNI